MFFTKIKELADHATEVGNSQAAEFLNLLIQAYGDIPEVTELQDLCASPEQALEDGQYYLGVYLTHMVATSLGFNTLGPKKKEAFTQLGLFAKKCLETHDNNLYILALELYHYAIRVYEARLAEETEAVKKAKPHRTKKGLTLLSC